PRIVLERFHALNVPIFSLFATPADMRKGKDPSLQDPIQVKRGEEGTHTFPIGSIYIHEYLVISIEFYILTMDEGKGYLHAIMRSDHKLYRNQVIELWKTNGRFKFFFDKSSCPINNISDIIGGPTIHSHPYIIMEDRFPKKRDISRRKGR